MAPVEHERGLTSVVVVAADSGPLLMASIDAALASSAPIEVILVDNASADGEPDRVAAAHAHDARLRVLRQERNIGFGPACNRGAAIARGDTLVFLNPDCTIEPDTIAALRTIAADDVRLGVLGIEIRSPDGKPARGNRRRDPDSRRAMMTMLGLTRFQSRWPALAGVEMSERAAHQLPAIEVVDAVSGAFLFMPRRALDVVGGFDESYFLHFEDLDLCRRVRDAGYTVAMVRALHAIHVQGGSSRHRPIFVAWHKHRGMWRYFTKFDPAARNPAARAIVWLGVWTHFVLIVPLHLARLAMMRASGARREQRAARA